MTRGAKTKGKSENSWYRFVHNCSSFCPLLSRLAPDRWLCFSYAQFLAVPSASSARAIDAGSRGIVAGFRTVFVFVFFRARLLSAKEYSATLVGCLIKRR